eukprot:g11545.t3
MCAADIHQGPKMIVKLVKKVGAALKSALKLHSRDALNSLPPEQQHCCRDTWARMVIAQHGAIHNFPSISCLPDGAECPAPEDIFGIFVSGAGRLAVHPPDDDSTGESVAGTCAAGSSTQIINISSTEVDIAASLGSSFQPTVIRVFPTEHAQRKKHEEVARSLLLRISRGGRGSDEPPTVRVAWTLLAAERAHAAVVPDNALGAIGAPTSSPPRDMRLVPQVQPLPPWLRPSPKVLPDLIVSWASLAEHFQAPTTDALGWRRQPGQLSSALLLSQLPNDASDRAWGDADEPREVSSTPLLGEYPEIGAISGASSQRTCPAVPDMFFGATSGPASFPRDMQLVPFRQLYPTVPSPVVRSELTVISRVGQAERGRQQQGMDALGPLLAFGIFGGVWLVWKEMRKRRETKKKEEEEEEEEEETCERTTNEPVVVEATPSPSADGGAAIHPKTSSRVVDAAAEGSSEEGKERDAEEAASARAFADAPSPTPGRERSRSRGNASGGWPGVGEREGAARPLAGVGTDSAIGSRAAERMAVGRERRLEEVDSSWLHQTPTGVTGDLGNSRGGAPAKKWDQFETNRRLFGVTAAFDENIYTTPLDKESFSAQQVELAERQAAEILGASSEFLPVREERNRVRANRGDLDSQSQPGPAAAAAGGTYDPTRPAAMGLGGAEASVVRGGAEAASGEASYSPGSSTSPGLSYLT